MILVLFSCTECVLFLVKGMRNLLAGALFLNGKFQESAGPAEFRFADSSDSKNVECHSGSSSVGIVHIMAEDAFGAGRLARRNCLPSGFESPPHV